mmetsp:Transcript_32805/g.32027  ORF Transcript_32805/g.32027 Transcript_32805/m.32027 type:complete len:90 (+) Transcript_32805:24-293(+)
MESGGISIEKIGFIFLVMFYEFFSQILFILAIILSNDNSIALMAGIFISIMLADPFTGAHLNPSVSLTVYIVEQKWRKNLIFLPAYWTA